MLRTPALYPLCRELEQHLPSLPDRLRQGLALWLKGTLLAHNGCQDSVAAALELHGCFETVRRELRAWTCDDADRIRSWGPETEVDVEACFPELLGWVRELWTPDGDAPAAAPLVLALDPTHHRDEWVALVVSVVYREHAIPVAWHVVAAQARGSWVAHFQRLLRLLAPAVPAGTPVHVLCDQGLSSRELWRQIVALGWHPVLRYPLHITFRPTGGARVPARDLGGGPGTLRLGTGTAFGRDPMPGTLVVLHGRDHKEPWLLLTDTPPDRTDADLYACRHWIEQGFRGGKRGGWQWQRTRRTDPVRVARHGLVLAVASLLAVAYGTRCEDARDRGLPPGRLRQGAACLRRLLARNRLWARVWLTPTPGPNLAGGLRCLSPPAAV